MGRGHESEVRVCDISVSRCHALLKYKPQKGMFHLEDNLSKFGTLVIPKKSLINLDDFCFFTQSNNSKIDEKIVLPKFLE